MKNQKGITLIALVITIIVLLILAGVSIALLTGENGLIKRAKVAKTDTEESAANEKVNMELQAIFTEARTGKIDEEVRESRNGVEVAIIKGGETNDYTPWEAYAWILDDSWEPDEDAGESWEDIYWTSDSGIEYVDIMEDGVLAAGNLAWEVEEDGAISMRYFFESPNYGE